MSPNRLAPFIYVLGLSCLVSACSVFSKSTMPETTTPDKALAVQNSVIDCEWKAADRFDDGRYKTFPELVHRVMDECAAERHDARLVLGLSPNDPRIDADEYKDAYKTIENARKMRPSEQADKKSN